MNIFSYISNINKYLYSKKINKDINNSVSFIIPIRNRGGIRLDNCLTSIFWQIYKLDNIEVIIVDYGSNNTYKNNILSIIKKYQHIKYIRVENFDIWNRSKVINIGLKYATLENIMIMDVDVILENNFIEQIFIQIQHDDKTSIFCNVIDVLSNTEKINNNKYNQLKQTYNKRIVFHCGPMFIRKNFLKRFSFPEKYQGWGYEDLHVICQLFFMGIKPIFIDKNTSMLHQYHKPVNNKFYYEIVNMVSFFLTYFIPYTILYFMHFFYLLITFQFHNIKKYLYHTFYGFNILILAFCKNIKSYIIKMYQL
jgi:hypothetical protein